MKLRLPLSLLLLVPACGDSGGATTDASTTSPGTTGATTQSPVDTTADPSNTASPTTSGASDSDATTASPTTGDAADTSTGAIDPSTGDATTDDATTGPVDDILDPDLDGPWQVLNITGVYTVDGVKVPTDAYYPGAGPEPGPYPVVLIAHGFQLPAAQYIGYARRLASHGYVAVTVDYQAGLFNPDHVAYAGQVVGGIDWVAGHALLAGLADTDNVGLTGHSLGGKLAIHGAVMDPRVRASITLDPVDSATMCNQQNCPDVSDMLPIDIPLGFLGETLDGVGGGMLCAPAADNFLTYYQNATAPALAITVLGASHMSFIDDVDSCGLVCAFCKPATLDNAVVTALSRAYVTAFYGRHLRSEPGYDTYLTGAEAQARYVDKQLITIASK